MKIVTVLNCSYVLGIVMHLYIKKDKAIRLVSNTNKGFLFLASNTFKTVRILDVYEVLD